MKKLYNTVDMAKHSKQTR